MSFCFSPLFPSVSEKGLIIGLGVTAEVAEGAEKRTQIGKCRMKTSGEIKQFRGILPKKDASKPEIAQNN